MNDIITARINKPSRMSNAYLMVYHNNKLTNVKWFIKSTLAVIDLDMKAEITIDAESDGNIKITHKHSVSILTPAIIPDAYFTFACNIHSNFKDILKEILVLN